MRLRTARAFPLLPILFFPYLSLPVLAVLVNTTVDASSDAITYTPPGAWCTGSDSSCDHRYSTLHPSHTSVGTWPEPAPDGANEARTATIRFNGTAIYVYCVVHPAVGTNLLFFLDGVLAGSFSVPPQADIVAQLAVKTTSTISTATGRPGASEAGYSIPVYANDSLDTREHVFTVSNVQLATAEGAGTEAGRESGSETETATTGTWASGVLLDRIVYSSVDHCSSQSHVQAVHPTASNCPPDPPQPKSGSVTAPSLRGIASPHRHTPPTSHPHSRYSPLILSSFMATSTSTRSRTVLIAVLCTIVPVCFLLSLGLLFYYYDPFRRVFRRYVHALNHDRDREREGQGQGEAVGGHDDSDGSDEGRDRELPTIPRGVNIRIGMFTHAARARNDHPPRARTSISDDPELSGWAHGTWGAESPVPPHPSLDKMSEGTAGMRGDVLARDAGRAKRGRGRRGTDAGQGGQGAQAGGDGKGGNGEREARKGGGDINPGSGGSGVDAGEGGKGAEEARTEVARTQDVTPPSSADPLTPGSTSEQKPLLQHPYGRDGVSPEEDTPERERDRDRVEPPVRMSSIPTRGRTGRRGSRSSRVAFVLPPPSSSPGETNRMSVPPPVPPKDAPELAVMPLAAATATYAPLTMNAQDLSASIPQVPPKDAPGSTSPYASTLSSLPIVGVTAASPALPAPTPTSSPISSGSIQPYTQRTATMASGITSVRRERRPLPIPSVRSAGTVGTGAQLAPVSDAPAIPTLPPLDAMSFPSSLSPSSPPRSPEAEALPPAYSHRDEYQMSP